MKLKANVLDEKAMLRTITRLSHEILEKNKGADDIVLAGILSRGVPLAQMIADKINDIEGVKLPVATVDITMHRDDLTEDVSNIVAKTNINACIEGKVVVLVDDVLSTGRTVRAAIDAMLDIGRPRAIQLAVLIDRGHRELPIRPDYVGKNVPTSTKEIVKVHVMSLDDENSVNIYE